MRKFYLLPALVLLTVYARAEGTRQVAPNGNITIDGNTTTDLAAIHLDHPSYNNFAAYDNPDTNSRLNIRIVDPNVECIYLGFSEGHLNQTGMNPPLVSFEFRIKDPNGNVVFGPVTIDPADANVSGWSEAFAGPSEINGPSGYAAIVVESADLISQGWATGGDYYIEFREQNQQPLLIDFWDITVADCSGTFPEERQGRLWSYNWAIFAINDFGFPVRPFNGAFYVCAPDIEDPAAAFVTRIDFNGSGFRPAAFNVAFNSFGSMNTGDVPEDRKSVEGVNSTQSEYAIFLNDPVEFCETAVAGEVELLGISRCTRDDYCIRFSSNRVGQIDLLLDFDGGDGVFTPGTADLLITTIVGEGETNIATCIDWDGLDGLGQPIPDVQGTSIPVVLSYAQGIYHFPIYDAEFMDNGFMVEAVRPSGDIPLLFYDDSNISTPSGSGEPQVQLSGCNVPCHRWSVFNNPNVPGFGNLNTINSWWFAQQIVVEEVFVIPSYAECEISGPEAFCEGTTASLSWNPISIPDPSAQPVVTDITWTGPGIVGSNKTEVIEVDQAGIYMADFVWLTELGDSCFASCTYEIDLNAVTETGIDTTVGFGDTLFVNGVPYSESGEYTQTLVSSNGCDSILIISLTVPQTVIEYDFDDCFARFDDGTNADYSEFLPQYPDPLECGVIEGGFIFRENPMVNRHSCTPGVEGSIAMCVSSLDSCDYVAGDERSIVLELNITPDTNSIIVFDRLSFFEQAPEEFDWIDGNSGPNNYPTLYGLRVLKDGEEILRLEDLPTSTGWTEEVFDLAGLDGFEADQATTYRFEFLGYCLAGVNSTVTAWDMDQLTIQASCAPKTPPSGIIAGSVAGRYYTVPGRVQIRVASDAGLLDYVETSSDLSGNYTQTGIPVGQKTWVAPYKNDDVLFNVTTRDLITLMKHVIELESLATQDQYLAADIDGDGEIGLSDVILMRKVLLGLENDFGSNTSWRFWHVPADTELADLTSLEEIAFIGEFPGDTEGVNFTGLKIGDLNIDNLLPSGAALLSFDDRVVRQGFPTSVTLRLEDIEAFAGMQCAISVDGRIESTESEYFHVGLNSDADVMRLIATAVQTNSEDPLELTFSFVPERDGYFSEMIAIQSESNLIPEAYVGEKLEPLRIELVPNVERNTDLVNLAVQPNPFMERAQLIIRSTRSGDASLEFFDITGRLLDVRRVDLHPGMQTVSIDSGEWDNQSSVIIGRLTLDGEVFMVKMVSKG